MEKYGRVFWGRNSYLYRKINPLFWGERGMGSIISTNDFNEARVRLGAHALRVQR